MQFKYQIIRLRDMAQEFARLTKLSFTPSHVKTIWGIYDYVVDRPNGRYGMEYRYVPLKKTKNDRFPGFLKDSAGNEVEVRRDSLDQILGFISDRVRLFYGNVIREGLCSHPHEDVRIEWDGDSDYGYCRQHVCGKCGGYLLETDIDRYLPVENRHPELVKEDYVPRYVREQRERSEIQSDDTDPSDSHDWGADSDWDMPSYGSEIEYEENQKRLRDSFKDNSDTHFGMSLDEYIAKFKELGFEEVLHTTFQHSHCGREREDAYYVFAHRDGFLIDFDTYTHDNRTNHDGSDAGFSEPQFNSGHLYHNTRFTYASSGLKMGGSGGYADYNEDGPNVWAGYHDVREGLSYHMEQLKATGGVCNPWVSNPIHWLTSHNAVREQDRSDPKEWGRWTTDMMSQSDKNFAMLPEWVQQMIGPVGAKKE